MRIMNIEDVKVNSVVLVGNTCSKHGNSFGWEKMMSNKKTITDNTVTYSIEVNNGFKDNVTFRFLAITKKIIKSDGEKHEYFEVLMEDINNEFGKIACRASEIRNTKSLKNKLTNEYRKTLTIKNNATKDLKKHNEKISNELHEQKTINEKLSRINYVLNTEKATLENKYEDTKDELCYTQDKLNNALVVIKEKDNEIAILNEKIDGLNQSLFNVKTEKITYTDNGLEQFLHMAETLANAKVNHDSFKTIMREQFENLFLNQD